MFTRGYLPWQEVQSLWTVSCVRYFTWPSCISRMLPRLRTKKCIENPFVSPGKSSTFVAGKLTCRDLHGHCSMACPHRRGDRDWKSAGISQISVELLRGRLESLEMVGWRQFAISVTTWRLRAPLYHIECICNVYVYINIILCPCTCVYIYIYMIDI